jgi:hypothetical protein
VAWAARCIADEHELAALSFFSIAQSAFLSTIRGPTCMNALAHCEWQQRHRLFAYLRSFPACVKCCPILHHAIAAAGASKAKERATEKD